MLFYFTGNAVKVTLIVPHILQMVEWDIGRVVELAGDMSISSPGL